MEDDGAEKLEGRYDPRKLILNEENGPSNLSTSGGRDHRVKGDTVFYTRAEGDLRPSTKAYIENRASDATTLHHVRADGWIVISEHNGDAPKTAAVDGANKIVHTGNGGVVEYLYGGGIVLAIILAVMPIESGLRGASGRGDDRSRRKQDDRLDWQNA